MIGGLRSFIEPCDKIVLKPNFLFAALPEDAIVTHPYFIESVINIITETTRRPGNITIVDSPASIVKFTEGGLKNAYDEMGVTAVARRTGCNLNFNTKAVSLPFKEGLQTKRFDVLEAILEADIIINLPKLKTHGFSSMSGAVKNLFGVIPGTKKTGYHMKFNNVSEFARMLIDLSLFIKPTLNIIDGILALEGEGPWYAGKPRKLGYIFASSCAVALDNIIGQVVGLKEDKNPVIFMAKRRGISGSNLDDIELKGGKLEDLIIKNYELPKFTGNEITLGAYWGYGSHKNSLPLKILNSKIISNFLKPIVEKGINLYSYVVEENCSKCKTCVEICPNNAISFIGKNRKIKRIVFDYNKCIKCYCCSEMCPQEQWKGDTQ